MLYRGAPHLTPQIGDEVGLQDGVGQALAKAQAVGAAVQQLQGQLARVGRNQQLVAGGDQVRCGLVGLGDEETRQRAGAPAGEVLFVRRLVQRRQPRLLDGQVEDQAVVGVGCSEANQDLCQQHQVGLQAGATPLARVLLQVLAGHYRQLVIGDGEAVGPPAPVGQLLAQRAGVDAFGQESVGPQPAQLVRGGLNVEHEGFAGGKARLEFAAEVRAAEVAGGDGCDGHEGKAAHAVVVGDALEERRPVAARVAPDHPGAGVAVEGLVDQVVDAFLECVAHGWFISGFG